MCVCMIVCMYICICMCTYMCIILYILCIILCTCIIIHTHTYICVKFGSDCRTSTGSVVILLPWRYLTKTSQQMSRYNRISQILTIAELRLSLKRQSLVYS